MAWYRGGTVAVTNGSATVTGTNTDFVANVSVGHAFQGPDGRSYEVAAIVSATQLTLANSYQGATASGQSYSIQPTSSGSIDLAIQAATLVNAFGAIRDGIGQGLIASGTVTAPGLRFSADQDTGLRRVAENALAIVTGGVDRLTANADGTVAVPAGLVSGILGNVGSLSTLHAASDAADIRARLAYGTDGSGYGFAIAQRNSGGAIVDVMTFRDGGNVGIGTPRPVSRLHISRAGAQGIEFYPGSGSTVNLTQHYDRAAGTYLVNSTYASVHLWSIGAAEAARIDAAGNLLVGVQSGNFHTIAKTTAQGNIVLRVTDGTYIPFQAFACGAYAYSQAASATWFGVNTATGRSINAGGTMNASGADYAEYIRKALNCGTILKGDVCGIDRNGDLVKKWTDAVRYVVKSTDPNLVGGDVWSAHLGERPEAPTYEAPPYDGPDEPVKPERPEPFVMPEITLPQQPTRDEGEQDEAFVLRMAAYLVEQSAALAAIARAGEAEAASAAAQAEYGAAVRQYGDEVITYEAAIRAYADVETAAKLDHVKALTDHATALAAWEAELEAARQTVDRIAFSGQVPVNVDDATLAACEAALDDGVAVYLVAIARGAGIGVTAVREGDMTLAQYMRRVGCVWAIRDGRPWVDVQHG